YRSRPDEHRPPPRGIAPGGDGLPVGTTRLGPGAPFHGAVDVVVGNRGLLGLLDGVVEGGVASGVAAAAAGGYLDVLDELGEELAPPGVDYSLLVLRGRPLGVAA